MTTRSGRVRVPELVAESRHVDALRGAGFVDVPGPSRGPEHAFGVARGILDALGEPLEVIGDFVIPPAHGPPSRRVLAAFGGWLRRRM